MIAIIGNGISGTTAAINIRKHSSEPIILIASETRYFFSRTALMYVFMGHMKFEHTQPYEPEFWEENDIRLLFDHVEKVDTDQNTLVTTGGESINFTRLIIATGSKPNKFGWKGQDAIGVQGMYSKFDLELMEQNTKGIRKAVIIGGGLIGIEMAEMLLSRNIEVHFLVRERYYWSGVLPEPDARFIMDHFDKHHGLFMHYEEELDEILTETDSNRVKGIKTKKGDLIDCEFVGLTAGVSPNIEFIRDSKIEVNRGVLVNEYLETNIPNVYAIGDCAERREPLTGRKAVEQVWYTGKFMGETLARTITGEKTEYTPGHWFNSAKFFDIEYQTYGNVRNILDDDHDEFIYQNKDILLHFVFDKNNRQFIGINTFGLRLRHLVFNEWLNRNAKIEEVIQYLASANFDPEFYKRYESDVIKKFDQKFNTSIHTPRNKWWQKILAE